MKIPEAPLQNDTGHKYRSKNHKSEKPLGPLVRTSNKFASLEDVGPSSSEADVMGTSSSPAGSPSRSNKKGRPRSKHKSPIRLPS